MSVEDQLTFWAKAPSKSERERCDNAVSVVKAAINNSDALEKKNLRILAQGSYRNRTNVRQDSDVDICVLCYETFYFELPDGKTREDYGLNAPATYDDGVYRRDVQDALVSQFDARNVSVGNKAWNIAENTYRVTADVVACFDYQYYLANGEIIRGTAVLPKSGPYICNFPDQNYENGKAKNDNTGNQFRSTVRILKNLNNYLVEQSTAFKGLPSFLIESRSFWSASYKHGVKARVCGEVRDPDRIFGHQRKTSRQGPIQQPSTSPALDRSIIAARVSIFARARYRCRRKMLSRTGTGRVVGVGHEF